MKKIILISLVFALLLLPFSAFAEDAEEKAGLLYSLGLFKGTENGFELERNATRVETAVTLVRLLGKEEKALYQNNGHPFGDVPSWASPYVGWLYENYMANGVSASSFGSDETATVQQFAAMILRTLGYSDSSNPDFSYDNAVSFANSVGLSVRDGVLSRGTMAVMEYNALKTPIKNSRRTLARKLCDEQVFSEESGVKAGVMGYYDTADMFGDIPENYGKITAQAKSGYVSISFNTPIENYGVRLFCSTDGGYYIEIPREQQGGAYIQYGDISYQGAAGYISEIKVYGLDTSAHKYSFIAIKASSTNNMYKILGKTAKAEL